MLFHKVAGRYDLMNDLMSRGLHRVWKDAARRQARPPKSRPFDALDVAGGTGDIAFRVAACAAGGDRGRRCVDINADNAGGRRAARQAAPRRGRVRLCRGERRGAALRRRIVSTAITIAFGIRNVPRIDQALTEAHRVLRRGGKFLCLEFSHVNVPGSTVSTRPIRFAASRRSAGGRGRRRALSLSRGIDRAGFRTPRVFATKLRARGSSGLRSRGYRAASLPFIRLEALGMSFKYGVGCRRPLSWQHSSGVIQNGWTSC